MTEAWRRPPKRIQLVPWDRCPCGGLDGVHLGACEARSMCVMVGCGRMIEQHAEMEEDGLCHRCTEAFIQLCLDLEAA